MKPINKLTKLRRMLALLGSSLVLFSLSCTKKFDQINTNKNTIATIGPSTLPFLFSHAEEVATVNANNYQIAQNLFADQYAQYFACEATYFPSDRLTIRQDWVGANFNPYYSDVLPALQTIFSQSDSISPMHAMGEVIWVLAFHKATDYWGPIPYFNIGTVASSVPYDPQDKIYDDFFKRLTAAVNVLTTFAGQTTYYGSYDLIYGGDVNKWIKFANTLRLRLAMRISKVDPTRAQSEAEAAVAAGVMTTSPADDGFIQRSSVGGDNNGLSIMSDWNEFRMSATMASVLKGYQDPRIVQYFLPTANSGNPIPGIFANYSGLRNGLSVDQLGEDKNLAAANSHQGARWASTNVTVGGTIVGLGTYASTPQNVIETAEAYFLRAEGVLLGWNMGGQTAQQLYEAGIQQSMAQWNITDAAGIANYIISGSTPTAPGDYLNSPAVSNVPIKWSTDPAIQLQQIATQKWLALFPDGMEAWADWRRSHVMKLYPVVNSDNPLIPDPTTKWIRRIPFLDSEKQNNAAAVTAAGALLGGDDNVLTPLWWDKN